MRIVHAAMFAVGILYTVLPEFVIRPSANSPDLPVLELFAVVALVNTAAALIVRKRLVEPSAELLRMNPEDLSAAKRWTTGIIVSLALAESIILFGLVLRVLGTPLTHAALFYAMGALIMVILTPQRP